MPLKALLPCFREFFIMKSKAKAIIALVAVLVFLATACTASVQTFNSAEALKEYLDRQPANTPDKPIKVTMNANAPMLEKIAAAITASGKYVSLNLSGNALTAIPKDAFYDRPKEKGCATLVAITIPNTVTSIGESAFRGCTSLVSVKFEGSILDRNLGYYAFPGNLVDRSHARGGGPGTYTRPNGSDT
jgi:hypothetical protein